MKKTKKLPKSCIPRYTFILKTPPASVLLANAAQIKKGSSSPKKVNLGSITKTQLEEIATIKLPDLNSG